MGTATKMQQKSVKIAASPKRKVKESANFSPGMSSYSNCNVLQVKGRKKNRHRKIVQGLTSKKDDKRIEILVNTCTKGLDKKG